MVINSQHRPDPRPVRMRRGKKKKRKNRPDPRQSSMRCRKWSVDERMLALLPAVTAVRALLDADAAPDNWVSADTAVSNARCSSPASHEPTLIHACMHA